MIQYTFMSLDDLDPSTPYNVPAVAAGGCTPFDRDRTFPETEDYIRSKVRRGVYSPGIYVVYHDGVKIGTVDLTSVNGEDPQ